MRSSNSTQIYNSPKIPLNSWKLTGGDVCGLVILGIFIIGFISLIAFLRIRKGAASLSDSDPIPKQDDKRREPNCDTRVAFKNETTGVNN